MKAFLFMLACLFSGFLKAETRWVATPFWRAPFEVQNQWTLGAVKPELKAKCARVDTTVWSANGEVRILSATSMNQMRTLPLPGESARDFEATFEITPHLHLHPVAVSEQTLKEAGLRDELPLFTRSSDTVTLASAGPIEIVVDEEKSLQNISRHFSLPDLPVRFQQNGDKTWVTVKGIDTACDLIAKRSHLKTSADFTARLSLEAQVELTNLYTELGSAAQAVTREANPRKRAALLGFRLGSVLDQMFQKEKHLTETRLFAFMENFIDMETMLPNEKWSQVPGNEKVLSVPGSAVDRHVPIEIVAPQKEPR